MGRSSSTPRPGDSVIAQLGQTLVSRQLPVSPEVPEKDVDIPTEWDKQQMCYKKYLKLNKLKPRHRELPAGIIYNKEPKCERTSPM